LPLYPVITLLGPDGTGAWSAGAATATITVLDRSIEVRRLGIELS
jgi:hypothetical protein